MNPIEMAFSKVKAWLQRHGAQPEYAADPRFALKSAIASVTSDDACGYMNHCGFPCSKVPIIEQWISFSPSSKSVSDELGDELGDLRPICPIS